jgi:hypothetical protein
LLSLGIATDWYNCVMRLVVFDVETKKAFDEVGGFYPKNWEYRCLECGMERLGVGDAARVSRRRVWRNV